MKRTNGGAFRANGDEVKRCRFCEAPIAWMKSARSGRWYPVNAAIRPNGSAACAVPQCDKRPRLTKVTP
jgi:hypothetical protein